MGPPLSTWPYSHTIQTVAVRKSEKTSDDVHKKCFLFRSIDNFRVLCLNFTFALVFVQVLLSLSSVRAGPVILNMDYSQGKFRIFFTINYFPGVKVCKPPVGL